MMPTVPIPALTKFSAAGHPNPPIPTIKTLEEKFFFGLLLQYFLEQVVLKIFQFEIYLNHFSFTS